MLTIILLVILAVSLVVAVVIVVRKFPQVANLDVEHLPDERETRKKKEIIRRRIESEGARWLAALGGRVKPLRKLWGILQLRFRVYVGKIERLLHHEQRMKKPAPAATNPSVIGETDQEEKVGAIVREGEHCLNEENYERAEKCFLAAIKIDPKAAAAYRGLADTYLAQKSTAEAEEIYRFILQLDPADDRVMVKIADLAEERGDISAAINFYQQAAVVNDSLSPRFYKLAELLLRAGQPATAKEAIIQAVELEPKNPKYLDLLIEVVIQCGDKEMAEQACRELRLINPNNQKLPMFWERIQAM